MKVRIETPIKPSEDPARVEKAVLNLFPHATIERTDGTLVATTENLKRFRDLVWKQRILDAARRILLGALSERGDFAAFDLNKQAALNGLVSFAVGSAPLGDLRIEVQGADLEATFKEMAPPTLHGHPVSEEEYERHVERNRQGRAAGERAAPVPQGEEE